MLTNFSIVDGVFTLPSALLAIKRNGKPAGVVSESIKVSPNDVVLASSWDAYCTWYEYVLNDNCECIDIVAVRNNYNTRAAVMLKKPGAWMRICDSADNQMWFKNQMYVAHGKVVIEVMEFGDGHTLYRRCHANDFYKRSMKSLANGPKRNYGPIPRKRW